MSLLLWVLLADTCGPARQIETRTYNVAHLGLDRIVFESGRAVLQLDAGEDLAVNVGREAFGTAGGRSCRYDLGTLTVAATPREHGRVRAILARATVRRLDTLGP